MATSRKLAVISIVILLASFYFGLATATTSSFQEVTSAAAVSPSPETASFLPNDVVSNLMEPILTNLGFQELAAAVPSLDSSSYWTGPTTLFAPSDASVRACSDSSAACSPSKLMSQHMVPGLFPHSYLSKLSFGTKIETLHPSHCLTITKTSPHPADVIHPSRDVIVFVGGVEITRPDLFNNGLLVIHGLQGYVAPLSPFSCSVERMNSLAFPYQPNNNNNQQTAPFYLMRLMLRDAMLRLRAAGFSVLSLAMKVKYSELVNLNNMTVFALDDQAIFSGSHAYVSSIRFHIVPNRLLPIGDLERLPVGTVLGTLERGEEIVVTAGGGGTSGNAPVRINHVRVKVPDVIRNLKVVVHSLYLPFPRLRNGVAVGTASSFYNDNSNSNVMSIHEESCAVNHDQMDEDGGVCGDVAPTGQFQPLMDHHVDSDDEDHHGL